MAGDICMKAGNLTAAGLTHGFFTREGGVSAPPYDSLNMSVGVGDDASAVAENRRRAAAALGHERLVFLARLDHAAEAVVATEESPDQLDGADIIVTETPGLLIGLGVADCVPVILYAPRRRVLAVVHAGWRGIVADAVGEGVRQLISRGAEPKEIIAGVGPCIGQDNYEVGPEVAELFDPAFLERRDGSLYLDTGAAVMARLAAAEIADAERIPIDVFADSRFYSYRREKVTGRQLAAASIPVQLLAS